MARLRNVLAATTVCLASSGIFFGLESLLPHQDADKAKVCVQALGHQSLREVKLDCPDGFDSMPASDLTVNLHDGNATVKVPTATAYDIYESPLADRRDAAMRWDAAGIGFMIGLASVATYNVFHDPASIGVPSPTRQAA